MSCDYTYTCPCSPCADRRWEKAEFARTYSRGFTALTEIALMYLQAAGTDPSPDGRFGLASSSGSGRPSFTSTKENE